MNADTGNPMRNRFVVQVIAAFTLFILGGLLIGELTPLLFPVQASAEAEQIDDLFKFMLVIGGAIFLLVQGTLLYAIIRFRRRKNDETDGIHLHGNATLELVWTAIPAVIALVLAIYSYQVWITITEPKSNEMTVTGIGQRFAWSFSYEVPRHDIPDTVNVDELPANIQSQLESKNSFTVNSNQLHTYVGRTVYLNLETADVQHAFWVPAMRIKQDLLPGRTTYIRFTPSLPGTYDVVCAELCGSGHGDMRGEIIVHPDEEIYRAAFFEGARDMVLYPPEDPVARGEQILVSGAYPCNGCHVLSTLDNWSGITGPSLDGIGDRVVSTRAAATGHTPEGYLMESLLASNAYIAPGYVAAMPVFQVTDPAAANYMPADDAKAIVAFLCSQTSSGESACNLDELDAVLAEYE